MSKPTKNKTGKPREVPEDIREKQTPGYSTDALQDALGRIKRKPDGPSAPGRGSAKT